MIQLGNCTCVHLGIGSCFCLLYFCFTLSQRFTAIGPTSPVFWEDEMKTKIVFGSLGAFVLLIGLGWAASALDLFHASVFAPWRMSIDREVQVQSRQFVESKQTILLTLVEKYEEARANGHDAHAEAILRRIRKEAALIPSTSVPVSVTQYLR